MTDTLGTINPNIVSGNYITCFGVSRLSEKYSDVTGYVGLYIFDSAEPNTTVKQNKLRTNMSKNAISPHATVASNPIEKWTPNIGTTRL